LQRNGSVVYARTLEFGFDLKSGILMVPRGYARTGTTPDGKQGLKWKSEYASLGMNGVGLPLLFDGLNEQGLAAGMFYSPASREGHRQSVDQWRRGDQEPHAGKK
jgi:choloylglycine hydrolase